MARFWILSDLHQEYRDNAFDLVRPAEPFDAVIAAGDVCGPAPDAIAWLRRQLPHDRIVYVPGNHDYWQPPETAERLTMDRILSEARDAAAVTGVDLLSDDAVEIAGARVLGATLWTDYRINAGTGGGTAHWMRVAQNGMNDYGRMRRPSSSRPTKPIRPTDLLFRHRASMEFLDTEMATAFDGPTVVVTHHAPHARSLMVQHDDLNPCYASDLEWLMVKHAPALWVHGHVHVPSDYVVDQTRVVCNPRGYSGEIQQGRWNPAVIVEV
ncbi:metallophosphoesterase [Lichenihabitans sp. Uapishka_5]|uniref:metallophosphoesterase n=1 Tax=Lichenihabitans sp. Uapishka_5 TaxID=3037302 RepID=UPI0029E7DF64|nr:metallophosphoesterase [Lichenihabitans sp. Uapishka_5]MDX7952290.1 metallophosphoesterase [Lichenihabitans sp. Uapishka_5]